MRKRTLAVVLVLLTLFSGWVIVPSEAYAAFDGIIKVRISPSGQSSDIRVIPHGIYFIAQAPDVALSDTEYKVHKSGGNVQLLSGQTVLYSGTKLTLVRAAGNTEENFIIFPYSPTHHTRTNYYGNIEFSDNSGLCAVNHVYVEDYVIGVIPYEMSPSWPAEALKAQAVCARNYGVRAALSSPSGTWHLGDTASSQVYKGIPGVSSTGTVNWTTYNTVKNIVNSTARKVMKYNGSVFSAYFSAWNGGETLNARGWTGNTSSIYGYTVVKSDVYDDRRCQSCYWISRTINTSLYSPTGNDINMAVQNMLVSKYRAQYGVTASNVFVVSTSGIKGLDPTGVPEVSVVYEKFYCDVLFNTESSVKRITFTDTDLKSALGISSSYIAFRIKNNSGGTTTLYNVRYGHGVGLSQRGAQQMANEGKNYTTILNFYYNGITISTLSVSPPTLPQAPNGGGAAPDQSYTATITNCSSYVNVRSGPSTSYSILGQAPVGTEYPVIKAYYSNYWHQVDFNGQTAFIHKDYIALTPVQQDTTAKAVGKATCFTYVYAAASTTSTKLLALGPGNLMDVLSVSGNYYKVNAAGHVGYVPVSHITIVSGSLSSTPTPTPAATPTPTIASTATPKPTSTPKPTATPSPAKAVGKATRFTYVYASASTSSSRLLALGTSNLMDVLSIYGSYYKVKAAGKTGYVPVSHISIVAGKVGSPTPTPAPTSGTGQRIAVGKATGSTYVYASASTSSSRLLALGTGNMMDIFAVSGSYYKVKAAGKTGYALRSKIQVVSGSVKTSTGTTPTPTPAPGSATTSLTGVASAVSTTYVYSSANTASSRLLALGVGNLMQVTGESGGFYKVIAAGKTGYVPMTATKLVSGGSSGEPSRVGSATTFTYVYTAPSASSGRLRALGTGNMVDILGTSGSYYRVKCCGDIGYVPTRYMIKK